MKTFLKYAWLVFGSIAFQGFILVSMPAKPGWFWGRIGLFLLVDVALGFVQWLRFNADQQRKQDLDRLRQRLVKL